MEKGLVIIPTYNEAVNIKKIANAILAVSRQLELLIIDDNSPDNTAGIVEEMMKTNGRIHLLKRPKKMGLGTAYVLGFGYVLEHDYDFAFEMDADFSHDPNDLPRFISMMDSYDLVIGSRYIDGVSVVNWPMKRLLLSYFACLFARIVTGVLVKDLTSGFKCYSRSALQAVNWKRFNVDGYGFQIQSVFAVHKARLRVREIPIIFVERREGTSKMHKKIIWEAFWLVWKLRFFTIFRKKWLWT
jgi:dolichol-phosphate mannosyltransferase